VVADCTGRQRRRRRKFYDALEEFHVHLQPVAGLGLAVALPPFVVRTMLLVCGQPIHAVRAQDAMHKEPGD
jgi:hypothetical protein